MKTCRVLEANTDGVLRLGAEGRGVALIGKKVRCAKPARPLLLRLKEVDLGEDPERPGRQVTDAVLVTMESPELSRERRVCEAVLQVGATLKGWPSVRLSDLLKPVGEALRVRGTKARDALYAAIPESEPGDANFWKLRREKAGNSKSAPWIVHFEAEGGTEDCV